MPRCSGSRRCISCGVGWAGVGNRGYAYFLYPREKPSTETAHDRLATIAQNSDLGAGMAVAMKDLDIRGMVDPCPGAFITLGSVRKWIRVTVVFAVLSVVGTVGYVLYRHHQQSVALASTDPAKCEAANAEADRMAGPFSFGRKKVDVIGDSYAVGTTLSDPEHQAWDILLAEDERWDLTVRGIGRTGFVNGGYCGDQAFGTRVAQVLQDQPELLIVEGGLNDAGQPGIGAAARDLLARIPDNICVVVLGPTDAPGRSDADKQVIDNELSSAAVERYISPLGWELEFGDDGIHMTAEGNRALADHVASALSRHACRS